MQRQISRDASYLHKKIIMVDMTLKIQNTLSGRKELLEPMTPGTIRMYVCGVTVYDYCHLGHARSALVFDVIRRHLRYRGFAVTFVKNFTDVDDKIIRRAQEQRKDWREITSIYITAYHEDMRRIGVEPATVEPKATEHMAEIIGLVRSLIDKGMAYEVKGDVYFQVETFPTYGMLSKRKLDDMEAGARVEIDERKRNPMDFALWKSAKPEEPAWPSPWGLGRPGWHIECSAMAMKHLGPTFDIHGGGEDLIFPHHENEIAQSSGASGQPLARYWIHNGFVRVNQEKMSKSLGNFFTIREIFEKSRWPEAVTGEMLRYFLLSTHYRSPLDFSDQSLEEAKRALDGFYDLFQRLEESSLSSSTGGGKLSDEYRKLERAFQEGMDDDFNSPIALAALQAFRGEVNKLVEGDLSRQECVEAREAFRSVGHVLGLFQLSKWQFNPVEPLKDSVHERIDVTHAASAMTETEIAAKLVERNDARRRKDFKKADEIRTALASLGITIEDRPDGTSRWKR
jgi:cysteinyl-tRNA synthetase